jgi:DNA-binding Lrp family transcriptional regulator
MVKLNTPFEQKETLSHEGTKMIFAYVLGKVEAGTETSVLNTIKSLKEMKKASLTYGTYDICVEAQFTSMEELDNFIINVLRKINGIKETVTLIASKTVFSQPGEAVAFG